MTERPTYTRRHFLHTGLAMVSTVASAPVFLTRSSLLLANTANQSGVPEDRVLVVIQLSGGNDGLNTVIPFGDRRYHHARPMLRLPEEDILKLPTTEGIGLHPQLRPLQEMIESNRAVIVQGVGYPNPNRSHFASMDVWHSGVHPDDPAARRLPRDTGWIGRALDNEYVATAGLRDGLDCVAIGSEVPPATRGEKVKPIAFERPDLFRWAGGDLDGDLKAAYLQLQQAPAEMLDDSSAFVFRTAMDAQVVSDRVRKAVNHRTETKMSASNLSRQLARVANMIRAGLPTRVYYLAMSGFDTHAGQLGRHSNLLQQFSQAVSAFYQELDVTGQSGRVVTLAFSEFGRRVTQNASGGTDHGVAGPVFLFGDHLNVPASGLIGDHPSLEHLDAGDLIHHTDFRSVYADVLKNWMHLDPVAALGKAYKPTNVIHV